MNESLYYLILHVYITYYVYATHVENLLRMNCPQKEFNERKSAQTKKRDTYINVVSTRPTSSKTSSSR
jgi:hypothetical protein